MRSWRVLGFLVCLLAGITGAEAGVSITRVVTELRGDTLYIDADARLELLAPQREALESGVPLTFAWEFVIEQERDWLWAREVTNQTIRARLEYHALSRLYRLVWPESEESVNFTTLAAALETLAQLRNVALGPASEFPAHGSYRGRARLRLVLDSLPLPLRPRAYFSERWALSSEWYLWTF